MKLWPSVIVATVCLAAWPGCSKKSDATAPQPVAPPTEKPAAAAPTPDPESPLNGGAPEEGEGDPEEAAPSEGEDEGEGAAPEGQGAAPEGEGAAPGEAVAPEGGADAAPEGGANPAPEGGAAAGGNALGFNPATHGFKFPNYGNEPGTVNLTAAEVRRMFGDRVCGAIVGGVCTLTPPARNWMEQINGAMGGGHCEGFAALSLLMQAGKIPADALGGDAQTLERSNERLQREIAYWFSTPATAPTRTAEIKTMTPTQVVEALKTSLAKGAEGELYTMGIYKPGHKDGHAITPYGLKELEGGKTGIQVYDNNYPGVERIVEVDAEANAWRYSASTNPNEPSSIYIGDASTFTLTLTPSSPRLAQQECSFCGELDPATGELKGSVAGAARTGEVWLEGDTNLFITDAQGKRLGTVDGEFVSEIAGGSAVSLKSETLWEDDSEPIYTVPVGKMVITVDGSKVDKPTSSGLAVIGSAFTFSVEGIEMDPGQKDQIEFSADNHTVVYKTPRERG